MTYTTRFAPSPTGFLHIGNLRTAIFNYIVSKRSGGRFILRLDDTDKERSKEQYIDQIKRDLEWLGFEWNGCIKQSERISLYETAAQRLRESGLLYECFETPEELEFKRRKLLRMGKPPIYDRASLTLSSAEKQRMRSEHPSYWRFKLDQTRVEWEDGILGLISVDAASISDPVLIRADGQFLYTLASVVDDVDLNISDVIRGNDHVTNTATQIQLLMNFKSAPPSFAHHSLLVGSRGEPLSKRMNNLSINDLNKMGLEPEAIFSFIARLGSKKTYPDELTLEELFKTFNVSNFGSIPTKFDMNLLSSFSQKYVMQLSFEEIKKDLCELKIPTNLQLNFWNMAKENISRRSDLGTLWRLCADGVDPVINLEDKDFITECKNLMPEGPRDERSWVTWTDAIKAKTSRSGKSLFLPLRRALTGQEKGPDMKKLFPLMQKIRL